MGSSNSTTVFHERSHALDARSTRAGSMRQSSRRHAGIHASGRYGHRVDGGPRSSKREFGHHSRRARARGAAEAHPDAYAPDVNARVLRVLQLAYCKGTQEVGYHTDGHKCVTSADVEVAKQVGSSLLYGEVLPSSVVKMLDAKHLDASNAKVLYDLGSGTGKLAIQAFLMYPNLAEVMGVELCQSRYMLSEKAALQLAARFPKQFAISKWVHGHRITVECAQTNQRLVLKFGDLLDTTNLDLADIIILQTDLPPQIHGSLVEFMGRSSLRKGCRLLSYLNLRDVWAAAGTPFPFQQHPVNVSPYDRFLTSWSYVHGHHFYLWQHVSPAPDQLASRNSPTGHVQTLPHSIPFEEWEGKPPAPGVPTQPEAEAGEMTLNEHVAAAHGRKCSVAGSTEGFRALPAHQHSSSSSATSSPRDGSTSAASQDGVLLPGDSPSPPSFVPVVKVHAVCAADTDSDEVTPPHTPTAADSDAVPQVSARTESRCGSEDVDVGVGAVSCVVQAAGDAKLDCGEEEPGVEADTARSGAQDSATPPVSGFGTTPRRKQTSTGERRRADSGSVAANRAGNSAGFTTDAQPHGSMAHSGHTSSNSGTTRVSKGGQQVTTTSAPQSRSLLGRFVGLFRRKRRKRSPKACRRVSIEESE